MALLGNLSLQWTANLYLKRSGSALLFITAGILTVFKLQLPLTAVVAVLFTCLALAGAATAVAYRLAIAAFVALWVPWPTIIPLGFTLNSKTLLFSDVLILAALGALRVRSSAKTPRSALLLLLLLAAAMVALINGVAPSAIIRDARGPLYLLCAYVIATRTLANRPAHDFLRPLGLILILAACVALFTAITGSHSFHGTFESVSDASGSTFQANRLRFPASFLALAAFCGISSLWLIGGPLPRRSTLVAASCTLLILLSFSRNHLITIGVAWLVSAIASRSGIIFRRVAVSVALTTTIVAALSLVAWVVPGNGFTRFIHDQTQGYQHRVIDGLSTKTRQEDSSSQLRRLENRYAIATWKHHLFLGTGWGAVYRPPISDTGNDAFWIVEGRSYIHNGIIGLLLKTGLLGLAIVLWFVIMPLVPCLRRASDIYSLVMAGVLVGFLAATFVVPHPFTIVSAPIVGLLAGLLPNRGHIFQSDKLPFRVRLVQTSLPAA